MIRLLFVFIGNIFLFVLNIVLVIPRLLWKVLINNQAKIWTPFFK